MTAPVPGDELFIGRDDSGNVTEAFRRGEGTGGAFTDISDAVDSVTISADSIHVVGRESGQTWHASCDRHVESTETHLRGTVRATGNGAWLTLAHERIEANMSRYGLCRRERDVALAMISERERDDIAYDLFISPSTIRNYVTEIARKLDISHGANAGVRHRIIVRLLDIEGLG